MQCQSSAIFVDIFFLHRGVSKNNSCISVGSVKTGLEKNSRRSPIILLLMASAVVLALLRPVVEWSRKY